MDRQLRLRAHGGRWMLLCSALALLTVAAEAPAAPPSLLTHQGSIVGTDGVGLNGEFTIKVGIRDAPSGGTLLYEETHSNVLVLNGLYALAIGAGRASVGPVFSSFDAAIFAGPERFLEITVNDELLTPRQAIRSVPYALEAGSTDAVGEKRQPDLTLTTDLVTLQSRTTSLEVEAAALASRLDSLPVCGNGVAEPGNGEECDGADLAGASCDSRGLSGGSLACSPSCRFDESSCGPTCTEITVTGVLSIFASGIFFSTAIVPELGGPADDVFQLEFFSNDTGTFDLASGPRANYATCEQCLRVFRDAGVAGSAEFFQSGGTLVVPASTPPLVGAILVTFTDVRLVEITRDPLTAVSTPVPGGACLHISSLGLAAL